MGYDVEGRQIAFRLSKHNSPQDTADEEAMEDVQAAVGALLEDPAYEAVISFEEGFVQTYRTMSHERRVRVIQMLHGALARVRTVTQEQAKEVPDDHII